VAGLTEKALTLLVPLLTERERQMQVLQELNQEFREHYSINTDIAARSKAYELAARMQLTAPDVVDFSKEPASVTSLYGIGERRRTISAGNYCWHADWRRTASALSRSATPAVEMGLGTLMET
jgi:hypothetical protein